MDQHLSDLKQTLKDEVYSDKQFPESKKQETFMLIEQRKDAERRKKHRLLPVLKTALPSLLVLGIFVLLLSPYWPDQDQAAPNPEEKIDSPILNGEHINILFTRVQDEVFETDINRAIVLSIHPNNSMKMINLDTRLNLAPNSSTPQNLTDLLRTGGMKLVEKEISELLELKLDYHFEFTNKSFVEMISRIEPPTVYNIYTFEKNGVVFPDGEIQLNGEEMIIFAGHLPNDPYSRDSTSGAEIRQTNLFISTLESLKGQPIENLQGPFAEQLSEKEMEVFFRDYFTADLNMDLLGFNLEDSKFTGYVELSHTQHNKETVKTFQKLVESIDRESER